MQSVRINSIVLSKINYQYELEVLIASAERIPQCFLLLGTNNASISNEVVINNCLLIPFNTDDTNEFNFCLDLKLLITRYDLIQQVESSDSVPLGIITLNDEFYNFDKILQDIFTGSMFEDSERTKILFNYEPSITNELQLNCFVLHDNSSWKRTVYSIFDDSEVKINNDKLAKHYVRENASIDNYIANTYTDSKHSDSTRSLADYSSHALEAFYETDKTENNFIKRLLIRINRIEAFLRKDAMLTDDNYNLLLRKISMLVSQLERNNSSEDIKNEIINKENEIKILQVSCNQWEMITPH